LRTASIPRARRASSTAPSPSSPSGCAETSIETLAYGYDAAGNLTSRTLGKTTQLALTYNADGRPAGAATESYKYDGFGERALINATATSHDIFGPGGELLAENSATGAPLRSYVYLNGLPLAMVDSTGNIAYILADQVGQPQKMVDGSGTLVWDRVPDEFGATVAQPVGMTAANPLRFPGQQYDAATGLHYNHFRDYDPALGRYVQSDPIGLAGGVNTYSYALGNPLKYTDPTGTCIGPFAILCVYAGLYAEELFLATVVTAEILSRTPGVGSAPATAERGVTYLYQKLGPNSEHLKFGITNDPATRYTQEELGGGCLKIIGQGSRSEMLKLERNLHETLPIGPEEVQQFYIEKQIDQGLKPPPYEEQ
jgi:RHS repeat-associated protein